MTDSPATSGLILSRGVRSGSYLPRTEAPSAIVIHTTGGGILRRMMEPRFARWRRRHGLERAPTDGLALRIAVEVYRSVMKAGPHYVVGQTGSIVQTCPESLCAWHVGGRGARRYRREVWGTHEHRWWRERWPDLPSPRDLAGGRLWAPYRPEGGPSLLGSRARLVASWAGGSANAHSIGIEVVPPLAGATRRWSDACWDALGSLVADIGARHEIPLTRAHVLSHSDAHPLARSQRGQPWDPGPEQWAWGRMADAIMVAQAPSDLGIVA